MTLEICLDYFCSITEGKNPAITKSRKIGQLLFSKGLKGPITDSELQKVVDYYLKYNKDPGSDTFQADFIKTMLTEELKVFQRWFNEILVKEETLTKGHGTGNDGQTDHTIQGRTSGQSYIQLETGSTTQHHQSADHRRRQ